MKNRKIADIIAVTRLKKLSLNENAVSKICSILKENVQIENASSVYQFVNLFNLSGLKNSTLSYIERCFTIVSDDKSFLDLEHKYIFKILASSNLLITSEIEVLKVANSWLNHNSKKRSQYAEDLLLKVRLYLLSTETLRHFLNDSTFTKVKGCVKILNEMFDYRDKNLYNSLRNYHTSRNCNQ